MGLGDDRQRLDEWLKWLDVPSDKREGRDRAVGEMRAAGAERIFPLLVPLLTGADAEVKCLACQAAFWVDAYRAFELVLPLLDDPETTVRWYASGCLHDFGDERAVSPLVRLLQNDTDAMVRGNAAYALGGIRSPAAIPALVEAMESDHEFDELGYSASGSAATALDGILGTHETRIRLGDGLCKLPNHRPDLAELKRIALEAHEEWLKGRAW